MEEETELTGQENNSGRVASYNFACGHCKECKHWEIKEDVVWNYAELTRGRDIDDYDILTEEESKKMFGYNVRFCESPKLKFWERPAENEATVIDGSQYQARLLTAENYGCVNFESKQ